MKRVEAEGASLSARTSIIAEVSKRYGSRCPKCMKPLSSKPELIEVQPAGKVDLKALRRLAASASLLDLLSRR